MSFMIPLNQIEALRARTVLLIGVDRDRFKAIPALRDGMTAAALIVPSDACFDDETPSPAPVAAAVIPMAAHACGDDWDQERWDGLS
jgi:hypothetical protein